MLSVDLLVHNKHFEKFWNFALNKITSKYASKFTCSKSCFSLHTYPYCSQPTSSINPTTMIKSKLPNEPHGLKSNGLQCRVGTWGSKPKLGLILGEVVDHRDGQEEDNQEKHWVTTIWVGLMDIVIYYLSLEIVSHTRSPPNWWLLSVLQGDFIRKFAIVANELAYLHLVFLGL
jgi:hypothetical protein